LILIKREENKLVSAGEEQKRTSTKGRKLTPTTSGGILTNKRKRSRFFSKEGGRPAFSRKKKFRKSVGPPREEGTIAEKGFAEEFGESYFPCSSRPLGVGSFFQKKKLKKRLPCRPPLVGKEREKKHCGERKKKKVRFASSVLEKRGIFDANETGGKVGRGKGREQCKNEPMRRA